MANGSSGWISVSHMGDLAGVLGSRLQPGLGPVAVGIWEVEDWYRLSLCVLVLASQQDKMNKCGPL